MPASIKRSWVVLLVCLSLALVTSAVYWPVLHCGFINFDDPLYVARNTRVQHGLTWDNVRWAATAKLVGNWHPLTWISHMLDCQLYGPNPAGHHATNLLFHTINTVLLFLVLRRMTDTVWRSAFVAGLFALHPLHVESVAWVSERKDVLSTFFWMLTIWAYVCYAQKSKGQRPKAKVEEQTSGVEPSSLRSDAPLSRESKADARQSALAYTLMLIFFALGLLAKPMLVTLPCLLLLLDFWPLGRVSSWARLVVEKVPLLALAIASSVITFSAQGIAVNGLGLPFSIRLENALVSYFQYIVKMLWPTKLVVLYPFSPQFAIWHLAVAIIVVGCLSFLAVRQVTRRPYLFTGWFWFLGTLGPVIGLVQVGLQSMADRYTYVPLIGLFLIVAWGGYDLAARWQLRPGAIALMGVLPILACIPVTRVQLGYWKDSVALFEHALRWTSNNYILENDLALALVDRGQIDEARKHLDQALSIHPDYAEALSNLGLVLVAQGKIDEGITSYRKAIGKQPADPELHHNLACALARKGAWDGAIQEFQIAVRLNPEMSQSRADLARALTYQGRLGEAKAQWITLLRLEPENVDAHANLGLVLAAEKDFDAAVDHLKEAARLRPSDSELRRLFADVAAAQQAATNPPPAK